MKSLFAPLTTGRLIEAIVWYRKMDIQEFSDLLGEHPMNVYKILNGRRTMTVELAKKIGGILNMPPIVIIHDASIELCGLLEK